MTICAALVHSLPSFAGRFRRRGRQERRRHELRNGLETQIRLLRRRREHAALTDVLRTLDTGSPLLRNEAFLRRHPNHHAALRTLLSEHVSYHDRPRPAAPDDRFVFGAWLSGHPMFTRDEALAAAESLVTPARVTKPAKG